MLFEMFNPLKNGNLLSKPLSFSPICYLKLFTYFCNYVWTELNRLKNFQEKRAVIVVCGVFREGAQYFGFSRNFVLECDYKHQYCITNEQLHVYNALNIQVNSSFEKPLRIQFTGQPIPFLPQQYWQMQETFQLITKLNLDYSRRWVMDT